MSDNVVFLHALHVPGCTVVACREELRGTMEERRVYSGETAGFTLCFDQTKTQVVAMQNLRWTETALVWPAQGKRKANLRFTTPGRLRQTG
jgi:hypothetical protein